MNLLWCSVLQRANFYLATPKLTFESFSNIVLANLLQFVSSWWSLNASLFGDPTTVRPNGAVDSWQFSKVEWDVKGDDANEGAINDQCAT